METQKTFPLVFSCSGVKVSLHWSPKEKTIDQDLVGFEGSEIEYLFCSENSICSVLKTEVLLAKLFLTINQKSALRYSS